MSPDGSNTSVTWRDYVDTRLQANERAVDLAAKEVTMLRRDVNDLKIALASAQGAVRLIGFIGLSGIVALILNLASWSA